jgi:hypothetical protein
MAKVHDQWCQCAVCTGARHEALRQEIRENIRKHGFHITGVMANPEKWEPPFTYTTGLEDNYGHAEIVVYGIDPRTAAGILHTAVDRIKSKTAFTPGVRYEGILKGFACAFVEVPDVTARSTFLAAYPYQVTERVRVLQLVWPDINGLFPWEEGFDATFRRLQPILTSNN